MSSFVTISTLYCISRSGCPATGHRNLVASYVNCFRKISIQVKINKLETSKNFFLTLLSFLDDKNKACSRLKLEHLEQK